MLGQRPHPDPRQRPINPPFPRIVCVVEPTRESEVAVEQAIACAIGEARVRFVAPWYGHSEAETNTMSRRRAQARVEAAVERAQAAGVDAELELVHASVFSEVVGRVTVREDLIVVGAHPHTRATGIVVGETATFLVHSSPIPVLLARKRPLSAGVVAATRAFPADRAALTAGVRMAASLGAELTVVHVDHHDDAAHHRELEAELANARALLGRPLDVFRPTGPAARAIVAAAEGDGAGLIVVGNRGLTGLRTVASVSERVAHLAPCSVLVMRNR